MCFYLEIYIYIYIAFMAHCMEQPVGVQGESFKSSNYLKVFKP